MVVRRAESSSMTSMYDFFTVYSPRTWLAIFSTLLIFMAFGILVHFTEWRLGTRHKVRMGDVVWRILRLQMNQHDRLEFQLSSGMFALGVFSLQCLITLSIYQSYIISSTVKYKNPLPFKPEDLLYQLQQKNYAFVVAK